jgi:hypothetical protein
VTFLGHTCGVAGSPVDRFVAEHPSVDSYWRAVVLFGRNVASYKFALAQALLELGGSQKELVPLEELALPFARRLCAHLATSDKQGTFGSSRFLDACREFNRGELDEDALRGRTVTLGFNNVIDAFHTVGNGEVGERFFLDERSAHGGIRLTSNLHDLASTAQAADLAAEAEARWRLVETAWKLNLPRQLLTVTYDQAGQQLLSVRRRTAITGARPALNGYQKGVCFYCFEPLAVSAGSGITCHVDHVFAWSTGPTIAGAPIDGVWNLVLACPVCNGWGEKSARPPHPRYVERLHRRNEFLIVSHHPLRPTLIAQTGASEPERRRTLRDAYRAVTLRGAIAPWSAPREAPPAF